MKLTLGLTTLVLALTAQAAGTGWAQLPPDEFVRRTELAGAISSTGFDSALLTAAIFHETNQVRRQLGLPAFTPLEKLDEAANLKAVMGVIQAELSHENPLPLTATPTDRLLAVGLHHRLVAENLARLNLLNVPRGVDQVGLRRRGGREEPYLLDSGRAVEPHTYASFAVRVVEDWMKSPPHRANIVNPALVSLGCAARRCLSWQGRQEQIYAVQVFFTPR